MAFFLGSPLKSDLFKEVTPLQKNHSTPYKNALDTNIFQQEFAAVFFFF